MTRGGAVLEVRGARELRRTMKQAGDDLQDLKDTHKKVGTFVAGAATPRTPVGATGALSRTVRAGATKTSAVVRAGGARVPYALGIHWGEKKRRYLAARPWITEAAQDTESSWTTLYQQGVDRVLARIKGA